MLKSLSIYEHGRFLGHVTWNCYIHIGPPSYRCIIKNFALIGPTVSEEKRFEYYGIIQMYMYIALMWGQMNPRAQLFFLESLIFSPSANFLQEFYLK